MFGKQIRSYFLTSGNLQTPVVKVIESKDNPLFLQYPPSQFPGVGKKNPFGLHLFCPTPSPELRWTSGHLWWYPIFQLSNLCRVLSQPWHCYPEVELLSKIEQQWKEAMQFLFNAAPKRSCTACKADPPAITLPKSSRKTGLKCVLI